ncbi:kinesin-like protein KIF20B isoform X1 [Drosophila virilis]|uniref:Uncharacterized protein, isoform A n=1 Tax=Drosophila virilis TaxID=7244 RepID=B4LDQ2_DROVI|nr:uncharacterized protein LOC6622358 isoform X1 [Drosophila virilis]EDW70013.1 uncharacterized protein Dvir_GJ13561, isoform A [Drosophila virilis]
MEKEMPTFLNNSIEQQSESPDNAIASKNSELGRLRSTTNNMNPPMQLPLGKGEEFVRQSRDELCIEQSSGATEVQHRGILIEQGIAEYSHSEDRSAELIGDCGKETVEQARDELVEILSLDSSYAQVKGILIEKGIMQESSSDAEQNVEYFAEEEAKEVKTIEISSDEEFIRLLRSDVKTSLAEEICLENELEEYILKKLKPQKEIPDEIAAMNKFIKEFTLRIDSHPGMKEWEKFNSCIEKVHQYYMSLDYPMFTQDDNGVQANLDKQAEHKDLDVSQGLTQVEADIEKMMEPLNELILRSEKLTHSIEGIEKKITKLDTKVDNFNIKYNDTLANREKSYEDMMALQSMRERIGQRLTRIETEIHTSKTRLLQGHTENK